MGYMPHLSFVFLDNPLAALYHKLMKDDEIRSFCERNGIDLLVLFGSCASDEMNSASDIDLAVKFRQGVKGSKLELIYELNDIFDGKEIDLVVLSADTDPLLLYEVFARGVFLYEGNAGIFESERLRAWKLYLDSEKIRVMQKKYLRDFVERVSNVA